MNLPHGLLFHHFHGAGHPKGQGSVSARTFREILEFAGVDNFLPAQEWRERAEADQLEAHHLCVTFDDNLLCQFEIALPVLEEMGMTAFWFIYTSPFEGQAVKLEIYRYFRTTAFEQIKDFYRAFFAAAERCNPEHDIRGTIAGDKAKTYLPTKSFYSVADRQYRFVRDRLLSDDDYERIMSTMMRDLDFDPDAVCDRLWIREDGLRHLTGSGHVIGLHSHSHPTRISSLSSRDQEEEFGKNAQILESIIGETPCVAAHPCGDYNRQTLDVLRRLGVRLAFRADMEMGASSALEQPRINHAELLRQLPDLDHEARAPHNKAEE